MHSAPRASRLSQQLRTGPRLIGTFLHWRNSELRQNCDKLAPADTSYLRGNFLANTSKLIQLGGCGRAQISSQLIRVAIEAREGFIRQIEFHSFHWTSLTKLHQVGKFLHGLSCQRRSIDNAYEGVGFIVDLSTAFRSDDYRPP